MQGVGALVYGLGADEPPGDATDYKNYTRLSKLAV